MKKNIAVITGGNSSEYEISLQSAETVLNQIDRSLYTPFKIIVRGDNWVLKRENKEDIAVNKEDFTCDIEGEKLIFDCVFISIHGSPGEDGIMQRYFDKLNIPYTTTDASISELTFDKNACKSFLSDHGVLMAISVKLSKGDNYDIQEILNKIGLPCFVKPNKGGSSCGISKVKKPEKLLSAIDLAFGEDDDILIEQFIDGRELTCGVIQFNNEILALAITEITTENEFFDYEAKYTKGMAEEITPAEIPEAIEKECKNLSIDLYEKMNCQGIVRFDYILSNEQLYYLELNTVPGLTETSLIPQQAAYAGITLKQLFSSVIENAISGN